MCIRDRPTTGMIILLVIMSSLVTMMGEYTQTLVKDGITMTTVMGKAIRQEEAKKAAQEQGKFKFK